LNILKFEVEIIQKHLTVQMYDNGKTWEGSG
jgi:hypothetical protein